MKVRTLKQKETCANTLFLSVELLSHEAMAKYKRSRKANIEELVSFTNSIALCCGPSNKLFTLSNYNTRLVKLRSQGSSRTKTSKLWVWWAPYIICSSNERVTNGSGRA
jgi:hypothetical protein